MGGGAGGAGIGAQRGGAEDSFLLLFECKKILPKGRQKGRFFSFGGGPASRGNATNITKMKPNLHTNARDLSENR